MKDKREVWQRGPLENMPALLQSVAQALLQAREEVHEMMENFPEKLIWERPAGVASPAFHLQHLTGVLNRLFTYAREESLTDHQLHYLSIEGNKEKTVCALSALIEQFNRQVDLSLKQLSETDISMLTHTRVVGRQKIPSTLIGLYIHAAEHSMRHVGQLLVTVRVILNF